MAEGKAGAPTSPVTRGDHDDLLRLLHAEGLSQREIAARLGVSKPTVARRSRALGLRFDRGRKRKRHVSKIGRLQPGRYAKDGYDPHRRLAAAILAPLIEAVRFDGESEYARAARAILREGLEEADSGMIGSCVALLGVERQVEEVLASRPNTEKEML